MVTCKQGHTEPCPNAERAADAAVKRVFEILGVDVDNPFSVEEFRKSLRFNDQLRKVADRSLLTFGAILATGFAYALYEGIKAAIGRGGH